MESLLASNEEKVNNPPAGMKLFLNIQRCHEK